MDAALYVHGKGGSAAECEHYGPLFPSCEVVGLDYRGGTPREAGAEIRRAVEELCAGHGHVDIVANSIGAFFCMNAGVDGAVRKAYFISPIVDMEGLILGMMAQAGITEDDLRRRGVIPVPFGEDLSWDYLCFVRDNPVKWNAATAVLYGEHDALTPVETIRAFCGARGASLTVMPGGEHWFHTKEQMDFLDNWIKKERI